VKVLDASALLAFLQGEAGSKVVAEALRGSCMSAANAAECGAKLVECGLPPAPLFDQLRLHGVEIVPVSAMHALCAAEIHASTRSRGLSLGDRLCLALAIRRELSVLTADRAWAEVDVGVDVILIR